MTYKEIINELIEEITIGILEKGSKIPSETQLSIKYECNRHTIRKAIEVLVEKGYLRKDHKGPTYVNEDPSKYSLSLSSLYDLYIPQEINTTILTFEKRIPLKEISEKMKLKEGEEVWFIKRLREIKGEPHHIEQTYMPYRAFMDLTPSRCKGSILNYIEEKEDYIISHGIKSIKGILIEGEVAKFLKINEKTIGIQVENIGYLTNGRIYEYSINIHRENCMTYYAKK